MFCVIFFKLFEQYTCVMVVNLFEILRYNTQSIFLRSNFQMFIILLYSSCLSPDMSVPDVTSPTSARILSLPDCQIPCAPPVWRRAGSVGGRVIFSVDIRWYSRRYYRYSIDLAFQYFTNIDTVKYGRYYRSPMSTCGTLVVGHNLWHSATVYSIEVWFVALL